MISSLQIVFLIDGKHCWGPSAELNQHDTRRTNIISKCLNILMGYSSMCINGHESIRWSFKFFNAPRSVSDTTRRHFKDFDKGTFEVFIESIEEHFKFLSGLEEDQSISNNTEVVNLKKPLQETLVDYDWDRPIICSPIKFHHSSSKRSGFGRSIGKRPQPLSEANAVIVFTSLQENEDPETVTDLPLYFQSIVDETLRKQFLEKNITLHLVNTSIKEPHRNVKSRVAEAIKSYNGAIHELGTMRSNIGSIVCDGAPKYFKPVLSFVNNWWFKSVKRECIQYEKESESSIIWEDEVGLTSLQLPITVKHQKSRYKESWSSLVVCGVVHSDSIPLLCLTNPKTDLSLCSSSNSQAFMAIMQILKSQDCLLILRHQHNGIAILGPLTQQMGCLVTISSSGLATPPIAASVFKSSGEVANESLNTYIDSLVKKALMSAPPMQAEPSRCGLMFDNEMLKSYYPPTQMPLKSGSLHGTLPNKRSQMLKKLKTKYRPQLPEPVNKDNPNQELIDVTQPASAAAIPVRKCSPPFPVNPQKPVTRGQQLASRGLFLTTHKKSQNEQNLLDQKHQANKRKVEAAEERTRRSSILSSKILKDLGSSDSSSDLRDSLVNLRNNLYAEKENSEESNPACDDHLLIISQTMVNTALAVLRCNCTPFLVESELQATMADGIFLSPTSVISAFKSENHLSQMKLQVLLHLELIWNSMSSNDISFVEITDQQGHTDEILKHLRAISLKFDPTIMASFLEQTILPSYHDSIGKVLCHIYEELNQVLPECLKSYLSQEEVSPVKSIKSISSQQTESLPKSTESAPGQMFRRMSSRIAIKNDTNSRQIVVPRGNKGIKKTQSSSSSRKGGMKQVRRNLFDIDDGSENSNLRRCKTLSDVPCPPTMGTPRKRKSDAAFSCFDETFENDSVILSPTKAHSLLASKRRKVYALETPSKLTGKSIFNANRLCKSTGATTITESPDAKRLSDTSREARALTIARRRSFYSRGHSRNFDQGRRSLHGVTLESLPEASRQSERLDGSFLFGNMSSDSIEADKVLLENN